MPKSEYIPFDELPPQYAALGNVLPHFVNSSQLGFDVNTFRRTVDHAGFNADTATIIMEQGATSETRPAVVGVGSDGTALAGGTSVRRERLSHVDGLPAGVVAYRAMGDLTLKLHGNEIKGRVQAARQPLRDPSAWARPLQSAVAGGLRHAAYGNLVKPPIPLLDVALCIIGTGILSLGMQEGLDISDHIEGMVTLATVYPGVRTLLAPQIASFLGGPKPLGSTTLLAYVDRYAVVQYLTRRRPLISPLADVPA